MTRYYSDAIKTELFLPFLKQFDLHCLKRQKPLLLRPLPPFAPQTLISTTFNINIMEVKDCNGNLLNEGDSVTLIKDLKVKGSSAILKRGTKVKGIRLTDNEEEIEGRIEKTVMVLKTCFLKKA